MTYSVSETRHCCPNETSSLPTLPFWLPKKLVFPSIAAQVPCDGLHEADGHAPSLLARNIYHHAYAGARHACDAKKWHQ